MKRYRYFIRLLSKIRARRRGLVKIEVKKAKIPRRAVICPDSTLSGVLKAG
jgi:hypothetical protein